MNASEFYEDLLGLSNLKVVSIKKEGNKIILNCELTTQKKICPKCGREIKGFKQYKKRLVRDLDISGKEVWLNLRIRQYKCDVCKHHFTQGEDWLLPYKSYTKRQGKWIFEMCAKQPFTEAGSLLFLFRL